MIVIGASFDPVMGSLEGKRDSQSIPRIGVVVLGACVATPRPRRKSLASPGCAGMGRSRWEPCRRFVSPRETIRRHCVRERWPFARAPVIFEIGNIWFHFRRVFIAGAYIRGSSSS